MVLNDALRGAWQAQLQQPAGSGGGAGRYERLVMEAVDCFIQVGRREGKASCHGINPELALTQSRTYPAVQTQRQTVPPDLLLSAVRPCPLLHS